MMIELLVRTQSGREVILYIAIGILLCGCGVSSNRKPWCEPQAERNDSIESVRLRTYGLYPYIRVQTSVGLPMNLLVDTGAHTLVMAEDASHEIQDKQYKGMHVVVDSQGRRIPAKKFIVKTLHLGAHALTNVEIAAFPRSKNRLLSRSGIDGLLGGSLFKNRIIFLDWINHRVRLGKSGSKPSIDGPLVPFAFNEHMVQVGGAVNGKACQFLIDTGTLNGVITPEFADQLGLAVREEKDRDGKLVRVANLPSVRVGSYKIDSVVVVVKHSRVLNENVRGIIGFHQLIRLGGIEVDYEKRTVAFPYLSRMLMIEGVLAKAKSGDAWAQYWLSKLRTEGEEIPGDSKSAMAWLLMAGNGGCELAAVELGEKCYWGSGGQSKDLEKAHKWFSTAAKTDHPRALWHLGHIYRAGLSVKKDLSRAYRYFKKAASLGYLEAQADLGWSLLNGSGVERDHTEGLLWLKRAAFRGEARAQCNLGVCYLRGFAVKKDPAEALRWYHRSADDKFEVAMYNIGNFHEQGQGGKVDIEAAKIWYRKAAERGHKKAKAALERLDSK